jgi:hypothetical protein
VDSCYLKSRLSRNLRGCYENQITRNTAETLKGFPSAGADKQLLGGVLSVGPSLHRGYERSSGLHAQLDEPQSTFLRAGLHSGRTAALLQALPSLDRSGAVHVYFRRVGLRVLVGAPPFCSRLASGTCHATKWPSENYSASCV